MWERSLWEWGRTGPRCPPTRLLGADNQHAEWRCLEGAWKLVHHKHLSRSHTSLPAVLTRLFLMFCAPDSPSLLPLRTGSSHLLFPPYYVCGLGVHIWLAQRLYSLFCKYRCDGKGSAHVLVRTSKPVVLVCKKKKWRNASDFSNCCYGLPHIGVRPSGSTGSHQQYMVWEYYLGVVCLINLDIQ